MIPNDRQTLHPSPDGRHFVVTTAEEVRMSHWIESAELRETGTDRLVVAVGSTSWSADRLTWSSDGKEVAMNVRRYPGDHGPLRVRLWVEAARAEIAWEGGAEEVSFDGLGEALERAYGRVRWVR